MGSFDGMRFRQNPAKAVIAEEAHFHGSKLIAMAMGAALSRIWAGTKKTADLPGGLSDKPLKVQVPLAMNR